MQPNSDSVSLEPDSRPQTAYRRRRTSSSSSMAGIVDADDSIVLSDLVRTGEASRLRRRGALRLDRNSVHINPPSLRFPPEDSDSDDENRPYSFAYGQSDLLDRRHRAFTSHQLQYPSYSRWLDDDDENMPYILVCGAEVDAAEPSYLANGAPFEPSILPIPPTKASSSSGSGGSNRVSNGCGAIIHFSASQHSTQTYTAKSPATDAVVPLAAEYFNPHVGIRFETSSCGCVKEGIGCAICGNSLGTRWRFCERMSEGRRKGHRRRRRGPIGPEGPRYWGGSPSRSSSRTRNSQAPCPATPSSPEPVNDPPLELYTFFAGGVTAYADPTFTPSKRPRTPCPPTVLNTPTGSPTRTRRDASFDFPATLNSVLGDTQEVNIQFGGYAQPQRRSSLPEVVSPAYTFAPPLFDRGFTSSPESFHPELPLDRDGVPVEEAEMEPFEALMSTLREEETTTTRTRTFSLNTDGVVIEHPQPQPMSFYEQQVLGAWEREREAQSQQQSQQSQPPSRQTSQQHPPWPATLAGIQLSRAAVVVRPPLAPWRTDSGPETVVYDFDLNDSRGEESVTALEFPSPVSGEMTSPAGEGDEVVLIPSPPAPAPALVGLFFDR